jgi:Fe-Mn family superoxide dismutase
MSHNLPRLPYAYDALEPFLSRQALEIHYEKHHRSYVERLNAAEGRIEEAREAGDFASIRAVCDALSFNYSGHLFHSIYWQCMSPDGGGEPEGALAHQIERDFGGLRGLRSQMVAATTAVQASGWGVLAWQPLGQRLVVLQAEKHQNLAQWGAVPLLVLDAWEHAYYLDYQNERARYSEAFFDVVDWEFVGRRLEQAR